MSDSIYLEVSDPGTPEEKALDVLQGIVAAGELTDELMLRAKAITYAVANGATAVVEPSVPYGAAKAPPSNQTARTGTRRVK